MAETRATRRDEVRPGDVFRSSHGYRLLVTEIQDNATNRTEERHVGILGHLHADPENVIRGERYPAASTVEVELAPPESYLTFRFDASGLTGGELAALAGEVWCQAEASDGHPAVRVEEIDADGAY